MRLSVQLFTLREPLAADLDGTLRSVAEMGLGHVELAGLYGQTPEAFAGVLDRYGLHPSGSHVSLESLEESFSDVVVTHRTLGTDLLIVPWVDQARYAQGWERLACEMSSMGRRLQEEGMRLAYHNHSFEFALQDGRIGLERFYESADAELVQAQLDVAWVKHGGGDPAAWIRRLAGRLPSVHLKDITEDPSSLDIEAGRGTIDWDSVLQACGEAGVGYGVIELDNCPGAPLESVRMSYDFFRSKGLR